MDFFGSDTRLAHNEKAVEKKARERGNVKENMKIGRDVANKLVWNFCMQRLEKYRVKKPLNKGLEKDLLTASKVESS